MKQLVLILLYLFISVSIFSHPGQAVELGFIRPSHQNSRAIVLPGYGIDTPEEVILYERVQSFFSVLRNPQTDRASLEEYLTGPFSGEIIRSILEIRTFFPTVQEQRYFSVNVNSDFGYQGSVEVLLFGEPQRNLFTLFLEKHGNNWVISDMMIEKNGADG